MKNTTHFRNWMVFALAVCAVGFSGLAIAGEETESPAQADEKVSVAGTFVRVAQNSEGWVVLGYGTANGSVKEEWMLLNLGLTLQRDAKDQKITRDQVTLVMPDGQAIPLPSNEEFAKARGALAAVTNRDDMMHESINYFPPGTNQPCRIGFFSDPTKPMQSMAYDQVDLNPQRACVGRLYFQVPGGIQLGTYNLDVAFSCRSIS